jgi:lipid II:glycine glycyltransferase (peptidoglycan interpeptide bridge formation enzyme)
MKLERIALGDEAAMDSWDRFVDQHPGSSPFHHSSWLRTIRASYSFEPHLYIIKNESSTLCGVFPLFQIRSPISGRRIVSLPFSDYGGPLVSDCCHEDDFVQLVRSRYEKSIRCMEIRSTIASSKFLKLDYFKRHVLKLDQDLEKIHGAIDKKTIAYSIRKAEKANVVVRQDNTGFGIREFCRLNDLTRRKHGVPCQPHRFFDNLFNNVIAPGRGFIMLASHDATIIAASLFLIANKQLFYKYNASDPDALRKFHPNHLLTWRAIEWGKENGFCSLDFGRTSPDNTGLIRYKNMWGMKDIALPYYYHPAIRGTSTMRENSLKFRIMTTLWKLLPLPVIEHASTLIYKHLG